MQLMPGTAKDLGCDLPFDCDANLKAGTQYLAQIYSEIRIRGSIGLEEPDIYRMALAGYNAGPGYVYAALKLMTAPTWAEFCKVLPKAVVRGKTARVKDAISYAEKILPIQS